LLGGAWALLLAPAGLRAARAEAPRLVMLERADCAPCRRWLAEIGERAWNLSEPGRRAPLWRVDVAGGLPAPLAFLRDWQVTPTFVLVADGAEIGRILGYTADHFFWPRAEALVARLPRG
jgi:hypothetical protein